MIMNAFYFKSKTANGRIAKTKVIVSDDPCKKEHGTLIVIIQRILAKKGDLEDGYFGNSKTIFEKCGYILREVVVTFWEESFDTIVNCINLLKHENHENK